MSAEASQRSLISTNTAIRLGVLAFIVMASQLGAKTFGLIVLTTGFAHYKAYAFLNAILLPVIWLAFSNVREIPSLQSIGWLFAWLGVVHILMSLALSNEQPTWIARFFQAATRRAAALSPEQQAMPHAPSLAVGQKQSDLVSG